LFTIKEEESKMKIELCKRDYIIKGLNERQVNKFRRHMYFDEKNEVEEIYKIGDHYNVHIKTNIVRLAVIKSKLIAYNMKYGYKLTIKPFYGKHEYNAI
jgi:hypothetical protein